MAKIATDKEIAGAVKWAGFRGERAVTAIAIALAESGGNLEARNTNSDGSVDRGLWQINSRWHPNVSEDCADSIFCSTRQAWIISGRGRNFRPWVAYKSGAYTRYTSRARAAWSGGNVEKPKTEAAKAIESGPLGVVTNPLDVFQDIARFFGALLNPTLWLRVAEVLGGLVLIGAGIYVVSKDALPPGMRRLKA